MSTPQDTTRPHRQPPEGVPNPPKGFEYYKEADSATVSFEHESNDRAICSSMGGWRVGWSGGTHVAYRIGSAIHAEHFKDEATPAPKPEFRYFKDADGERYKIPVNAGEYYKIPIGGREWVKGGCGIDLHIITLPANVEVDGTIETDADGNPLVADTAKPQAKAREWWIFEGASQITPTKPRFHEAYIHVREIMPNEATLLREPESIQIAKIGARIIKDLLDENSLTASDRAKSYLEMHFPAAAPEFDYAKLWAMMPPWITCGAMDVDQTWSFFSADPLIYETDLCWYSKGDPEVATGVPAAYAPPAHPNWRESLLKRPTADSHE